MSTGTHEAPARGIRVLSRSLLAGPLLAVVALGGCDPQAILEVNDPDILTPGSLSGPEALPTVRRAMIGEFALSYGGSGADGSGGTEGVIMYSGLLGDEWINSETFPTRIEVDRRNIQITNATVGNWFRTLSRARRAGDFAISAYETFGTGPSPEIDLADEPGYAEALALTGFTYLFFAENWCSGIPFSTPNPDGSITHGEPLPTAQIYDTALARFTAALAAATDAGSDDLAHLASVGSGRVLLDQGNFAAAAAAVASVPTGFVYLETHSENSPRQNNGVFKGNVLDERYSVADAEGGVGLPYRTPGDPRIAFERTGGDTDVGFDRATPQYDQLRYTSRTASIPVASGLEARLIEAEATMNTGGLGASNAYLTILNDLRSAPPDYITRGERDASGALSDQPIPLMADLTDPGTAAGRVDQVFRERAFWLWLTGHRLSDMRRLIRRYGRAENTLFPTGPYFKQGLQYDGTDVNFPVPFDEENNPNFTQCLSRAP